MPKRLASSIASRTETLIEDASLFGIEASDPQLLDYPAETLDVLATNRELTGVTLGAVPELATDQGSRGVFVREFSRGGHRLSFVSGDKLCKGDMLTVQRNLRNVKR